jgi:hypothetical protein
MSLRNLQLGLALGAAEDLALFHFVLIDVDFSGTFGAADHVGILRKINARSALPEIASTTVGQLLYTAVCDVNSNEPPAMHAISNAAAPVRMSCQELGFE